MKKHGDIITSSQIAQQIPARLDEIVLQRGAHSDREQGVCLLEAVAWFAGEEHSDHPQCVDVVLGAYGRALNDRLHDDERQLLRPLIPALIGTRGSRDLAWRRSYFLVDRYVREQLPAYLRGLPIRPRPDLAERFEALPPLVDRISVRRARDLVREVRADIWRSLPVVAYADVAYACAAVAADVAYAATDAAYAYVYDAAAAAYAAAAVYDDAAVYVYDAAAAAAYAAVADAAYDAAYVDLQDLRRATVERAIAVFREAIALS